MRRHPPPSLSWLRGLLILWIGLLAGFAVGAESIRVRPPAPPAPSGSIDLTGAGATFPYPLYRRWFEAYGVATGVRINYFSLGSTAGLRLMLAGGVDFGSTDRPLTTMERGAASCAPLEVPTAIGAVAVIVHLPDASTTLQLDAETLTGIYRGRITAWDDGRLRALNPGVMLPALPIRPVHRGHGSGTATLMEAYLRTATSWEPTGNGWAVGDSVEGNEGVAAQVQAVTGSIGFVEASYADHPRLRTAALRNLAGRFVRPDSTGLALAAEGIFLGVDLDTVQALVGRADGAYPIAGVTRLVATGVLRDTTRARHFLAFARWAVAEGAQTAYALGYAPLPRPVRERIVRRLATVSPGRCPTAL